MNNGKTIKLVHAVEMAKSYIKKVYKNRQWHPVHRAEVELAYMAGLFEGMQIATMTSEDAYNKIVGQCREYLINRSKTIKGEDNG